MMQASHQGLLQISALVGACQKNSRECALWSQASHLWDFAHGAYLHSEHLSLLQWRQHATYGTLDQACIETKTAVAFQELAMFEALQAFRNRATGSDIHKQNKVRLNEIQTCSLTAREA